MEHKRVLYTLETADGIRSPIREMDQFMPEIKLIPRQRIGIITSEIQPDGHEHCRARSYVMRHHELVELVEFEEEPMG